MSFSKLQSVATVTKPAWIFPGQSISHLSISDQIGSQGWCRALPEYASSNVWKKLP
jgi:hypothetical protein